MALIWRRIAKRLAVTKLGASALVGTRFEPRFLTVTREAESLADDLSQCVFAAAAFRTCLTTISRRPPS